MLKRICVNLSGKLEDVAHIHDTGSSPGKSLKIANSFKRVAIYEVCYLRKV